MLKSNLKQIAENLKRPGGRVPDPVAGAPRGATIPTPPFIFGAKSLMRLTVASEIVQCYVTTDRELTASNMQWDPVIKNFEQHWKALKDRKKEDVAEVPKITKSLGIMKWTEAFTDFLSKTIGVRTIPLAYVVREEVNVPTTAPALLRGKSYSEKHGSVEGELVARASHDHPLYKDDNAKVYYNLEEATRSTSYAASIKPYQRGKDGRGAWEALKLQYAGVDKWRAELKIQEDLIHTRVWKGQSNFSLEKFVAQDRNSFVSMQQCSAYFSFQLPNETTRVTYLLDAIQCSDPALQAAMALVQNDTSPSGKMNSFEDTASFLLPNDPVARKRNSSVGRNTPDISSVTGEVEVSAADLSRPGVGKTGVELRYYSKKEYHKLSDKQKDELRDWRNESKSKDSSVYPNKKQKFSNETIDAITAAVDQRIEARLQSEQENELDDERVRSYIMSLIGGDGANQNNQTNNGQ